jgi:acyl carrier protein
VQTEVSPQLATALQQLGREQRLSAGTLVLGALAIAWSWHRQSPRIAIGTVTSGRDMPLDGVERIVGMCAQTLRTDIDVDAHSALLPWLRELQRRQAMARQAAGAGMDGLAVSFRPGSDSPPVDFMLAFQNYPSELFSAAWGERLAVVDFQFAGGRTGFPLTLLVVPGRKLQLRAICSTRTFTAETVRHVMELARLALSEFVADPRRSLAAIEKIIGAAGDSDRTAVAADDPVPVVVAAKDDRCGSEVKTRVFDIVRQLLQKRTIDPMQHFFALGGDSLRALQLCNRLNAAFGIDVSVDWLERIPNVETLPLAVIKAQLEAGTEAALTVIEQLSDEEAQRMLQLPSAVPAYQTDRGTGHA